VTIAISIKITDGLILASDSASTVSGQGADGQLQVLNVYNNAVKIFNLRKGLPIGAVTWGAGSIGAASISTIIKDLRRRFAGDDPDHPEWELKPESYKVLDVALRLKEFVFDELYAPTMAQFKNQKPSLGFIVGGYSAGAALAEEYKIDVEDGVCNGPQILRGPPQLGVTWAGEPEALNRLILGVSGSLGRVLEEALNIEPSKVPSSMAEIHSRLQAPVIIPGMPLQDAIDLAEFMVDTTIRFSRFVPGPPTVGGPIEIAAISKHEGFRWIKRKYYFPSELNPEQSIERVYEPQKRQ
jgi:hypothetical protein